MEMGSRRKESQDHRRIKGCEETEKRNGRLQKRFKELQFSEPRVSDLRLRAITMATSLGQH